MRRMLAAMMALAMLSIAAPARAGVVDVYQRLAERDLAPAPLVPTKVPPALRPIDRTVSGGTTRGGRGYSLRFVETGPEAVMVVSGGEFRTLRALRKDHRRLGFARQRRTRVRGHRGYLLTRRGEPVSRVIAWVERGVVYAVGSGTPRTISLASLRATAAGLDRLERDWIGASADPDSSSEAFAVTTARTISIDVSYEASCSFPGSTEPTLRVGQAGVILHRRQGNRFGFAVEAPWTGTVTGTIAPAAITLTVQATGRFEGSACDTGPLTLTLDRRVR